MSGEEGALRKELTLFDVYAICTGAMFSSGFFLLPGLAFAATGSSMPLAYLLAGLLAVPAMFSKAELATAMPKAGGSYFFLDRSFGPLVGTVGGLGTWLAMVLKTAFAFVGFGVYTALLVDLDGMALAQGLVVLFLLLNLVGAREASLVQRILVLALVGVMGAFLVCGLGVALPRGAASIPSPFLRDGLAGLFSTVGLVFVSYAGLTKVSSVAEEVRRPERNIPLGMGLSLLTSLVLYSGGAYVLAAVLDPAALAAPDLTPVASAATKVFPSIPARQAIGFVVLAAFAAFASTGNAAMLSASRYLLALGRDKRAPTSFAAVNSRGTPTWALALTAGTVSLSLFTLDVANVAKLASAFQLMIFSMENLALIVMRESRLESYDPGFRSPLYPWLQVVGFVSPFFLIAEMGHVPIMFSFGLIGVGVLWYLVYAREAGGTLGAVSYVLARLVRFHVEAARKVQDGLETGLQEDGLDVELLGISGEQELRDEDPYDHVVARALTLEVAPEEDLVVLRSTVARLVSEASGVPAEGMARGLLQPEVIHITTKEVEVHHLVVEGIDRTYLVLARCRSAASEPEDPRPCGMIFLISSGRAPSEHLRILTHLALRVEQQDFQKDWLLAHEPQQLRETLLRYHRFLSVRLTADNGAGDYIGRRIADLGLPPNILLAAIRRGGEVLVPRGATVLKVGDRITLVGDRVHLAGLAHRLGVLPPPAEPSD